MNLIANYPKKTHKVSLYVKHPVQVSAVRIQEWKKKYLLCSHYLKPGQWVAADVLHDGYAVPPESSGFNTKEECEKACDAHNCYVGWSDSQVEAIIDQSKYNAIHHQN